MSESICRNTLPLSISSSAESSFPIFVPITKEHTSRLGTDSLEVGETTCDEAYILLILNQDSSFHLKNATAPKLSPPPSQNTCISISCIGGGGLNPFFVLPNKYLSNVYSTICFSYIY